MEGISVMKLKRLPGYMFTVDRHELDYFARLGLPSLEAMHLHSLAARHREVLAAHAVGWAFGEDAAKLASNDHPESSYAVMFEDGDFEKFWCHVPKTSIAIVDEATNRVVGIDKVTDQDADEFFEEERKHFDFVFLYGDE